MKKILGYDDLVSVDIKKSGEPMVSVQETVPKIVCEYQKLHMLIYTGEIFYVRQGVADRLKEAALTLEERLTNSRLLLRYSYRHPEIQESYFEKRKREIRAMYPNMSETALIRETHVFVASPDVAGHPTGGAVDLTITTADGELDMGTAIADYSDPDRIKTFTGGINKEQEANRRLLRDIMLAAGFAPFDGEWWHFSYGDREWAVYYDKPYAIYDQVDFRTK